MPLSVILRARFVSIEAPSFRRLLRLGFTDLGYSANGVVPAFSGTITEPASKTHHGPASNADASGMAATFHVTVLLSSFVSFHVYYIPPPSWPTHKGPGSMLPIPQHDASSISYSHQRPISLYFLCQRRRRSRWNNFHARVCPLVT